MTDLTKMTEFELARYQMGWKEHTESFRLADLEWKRRERNEQHNLNLQLLEEQAKIMKSSNRTIAIFTITATLLGSIAGAVVQATLPELMKKPPKTPAQQSTQPDTKTSTSGIYSESKAGKVQSSPPK